MAPTSGGLRQPQGGVGGRRDGQQQRHCRDGRDRNFHSVSLRPPIAQQHSPVDACSRLHTNTRAGRGQVAS